MADDKRPNSNARGYGRQWQKLRKWKLTRDPVCEIKEKCTGHPATEVDHITPISKGGEHYDTDNLQSVCRPCHSWKTAMVDFPRPWMMSEYARNESKQNRRMQKRLPGSVGMSMISKLLNSDS